LSTEHGLDLSADGVSGALGRKSKPEPALVIHPETPDSSAARTPEAALEEAIGLTQAINLRILHAEVINVAKPRPATLLGPGQLERLAEMVEELEPSVVIMDHQLSPVQHRNLERDLNAKVIDRTTLILEIFGARARTREGRLQVSLAALGFQRSRLVRSWTHLERQRGGAGFMGGPGESQLEIDRRLIDDRIDSLKRQLKEVRRTRGLHRTARARVPLPILSLVGYTNAGKSTLFNRSTGESVFAKDQLFATLDPTMRAITLTGGHQVIMSDTVGFISDLPTHLVEAFRATLEEVESADVVVHVRDISHPDTAAQRQDVYAVLKDLGVSGPGDPRVIEVWNKADLLPPDQHQLVAEAAAKQGAVLVSAVTGEGMDALHDALTGKLAAERVTRWVTLDAAEGAALAWLYRHGLVLGRTDLDDVIRVEVAMEQPAWQRFDKQFAAVEAQQPAAVE